jgi:hypothetical protein
MERDVVTFVVHIELFAQNVREFHHFQYASLPSVRFDGENYLS